MLASKRLSSSDPINVEARPCHSGNLETSGVSGHGEMVVRPRQAARTIMAAINEPYRA